MSIETVNQFYQIVLEDAALQQQFQSAVDEESLVNLAVQLGQQQGYSFTSEDVIQSLALSQSSETTGLVELADEQLEAVAGGLSFGEFIKEMFGGAGATVGMMVGIVATPVVAAMGDPKPYRVIGAGASLGGEFGQGIGEAVVEGPTKAITEISRTFGY
jgi:predicted ribosomally synthesized peptide with nif11-like leader